MASLRIKETSYKHIQIAEEICLTGSAPFKEIKRSLTKRGGKGITAFPWQIDPVPLAEVSWKNMLSTSVILLSVFPLRVVVL